RGSLDQEPPHSSKRNMPKQRPCPDSPSEPNIAPRVGALATSIRLLAVAAPRLCEGAEGAKPRNLDGCVVAPSPTLELARSRCRLRTPPYRGGRSQEASRR